MLLGCNKNQNIMPYDRKNLQKYKDAIKLICKICGSDYFSIGNKKLLSRYCSNKCKFIAMTERNKTMIRKDYKGKIDFNCKLCNLPMKIFPCRVKSKNFCSYKCSSISRNLNQKNTGTIIEIKTKEILQKSGILFTSQEAVGNICIPDFYLEKYKIAIFCDGNYWHNFPFGKPRDNHQMKRLQDIGIKSLRFWEHEIMSDTFEGFLLRTINNTIAS